MSKLNIHISNQFQQIDMSGSFYSTLNEQALNRLPISKLENKFSRRFILLLGFMTAFLLLKFTPIVAQTCTVNNVYSYSASNACGTNNYAALQIINFGATVAWHYKANGLTFTQNGTTAQLTGRIDGLNSTSVCSQQSSIVTGSFDVNITFTGKYVSGSRTYYSSFSGSLTGVSGTNYAGAYINITEKNPDFYIEGGTSAGWFYANVVSQPYNSSIRFANSQNGDFIFALPTNCFTQSFCADGTPKKTPGTACNDYNPNTTNDVIQADGCGCAGTVITTLCANGTPKKTPGTPCNDNNPNTTNDVIQADGCSCAGTTTTNSTCNYAPCIYITDYPSMPGYSDFYFGNLPSSGWRADFYAFTYASALTLVASNILPSSPTATMIPRASGIIQYKLIVSGSNGCKQEFVFGESRCFDALPTCPDGTIKKTPGTACNDNNPNTTNDVIQADGCGCAGTPVACPNNVTNGGTITKSCNNNSITATETQAPTGGNGGALEYLWLRSTVGCPAPADAIPNSNTSNFNVGTVSTTTYFARCVRNVGCAEWRSSNCITVLPNDCPVCTPPVITTQPVNITTCVGNRGSFSVTATGTNLSYLWEFSYDGISGWSQALDAGSTTPVLGPHSNDFVYYRVKVSNSCGTVISNIVKQTYTAPTVSITGNSSINECLATTTTLTANGGSSYLWSNGATQAAITIGVGTYTVIVTDNNGCKATASKTVTSTGKQTPGTVCNDNNPNTENDVIQADGCTCAGTIIPKGSIGDFVFCDNNNNHVYDNGDTPISGVTVTLCNSNNVVITTTSTNASGNYSFGSLAAGTYIVKFPATLADGKNITTTNPITVNLAAGQNYVDADAGYYKAPALGSIGDFIFCDNNNNRVYDNGDIPISGVTVTLCNSNNVVLTTTTTNTSGNYSFGSLAAGTYIVKFPTTLADGKNITTTNPITINLAAGQNFVNADAGYYKAPALGSIGDFVFCDNNNNRVYDNGDTPISGVTVTLCNSSNVVLTTTTTNTSGNYSFGSLAVGTYIVKFPTTLTDGKNITTQNPITVNLAVGQNFVNADAGYYKPTSGGDFCSNPTANVTTGAGTITISGISTSSAMIQVFNGSWVSVYNQTVMTTSITIPNLPNGTYYVKITVLGAGATWPLKCEQMMTVTVSGGTNNNCPDGTPKKTPGTACNDNNPNTINDVIQADGCGCAGTPVAPNCNENRNNTITKSCVSGKPVLTGTALAGYEYMWLSSTSACPNNPNQAIAGATSQNYYSPSNITQTTYFSRCARPMGCTEWGAITESNCVTITPADCGTTTGGCDAISVVGNSNGTISVAGMGSYTSQIQIFNSQWQPVFNQQYNTSTATIPLKNGGYIVKVQLYNTNGAWQFVCEQMFTGINVSGGAFSLASGRLVLDLTAAAELHKIKLVWANNTGYKNDYFEVEKQNEKSGNFEKIAIINSQNGDKMAYYTAFDEQPTEGDNTYRINLIGTDGTTKISNQSVVKFNKAYDFRIFPNPVSDYIDVDLKQYEGKTVTLQVYNSFGKVFSTQQIDRVSSLPVHLDLNDTAAGQYLIRITSEGRKAAVKKFVIQK